MNIVKSHHTSSRCSRQDAKVAKGKIQQMAKDVGWIRRSRSHQRFNMLPWFIDQKAHGVNTPPPQIMPPPNEKPSIPKHDTVLISWILSHKLEKLYFCAKIVALLTKGGCRALR